MSIATVSKYINNGKVLAANSVRLAKAIRRLSYRRNDLARGLKTNRSMSIGVLIPKLEAGGAFFTTIISQVEGRAQSRGYTTIVCDYRDDPRLLETKLDFLMSKRVDGILAVPCRMSEESLEALVARRFPLVLFDRLMARTSADAVVIDNEAVSRRVVDHLIARGHRSVGIIVGPRSVYTAVGRLAGYKAALRAAGLRASDELIRTGGYSVAGGHQAMLSLLELRPRPTAVYATNYDMTLGALIALAERSVRLPRDLSFVGFDSQELAAVVKPALTLVTQPLDRIAAAAAEMLLRRKASEWSGFPQTVRLEAELHVRGSVARVRDGSAP